MSLFDGQGKFGGVEYQITINTTTIIKEKKKVKKYLYVLIILIAVASMFALVKMTDNPDAISDFGKETLAIGDVVQA